MTAREASTHLLAYLRREQRDYPLTNCDVDDPTSAVIAALNGALQVMAAASPLFVSKQPRSAWFRAPASVSVTGLSTGGQTATCAAWPSWAAGCLLDLPGDSTANRIVSINGNTASLQYPYMGGQADGQATARADSVDLDSDIIKVMDPVMDRNGFPLRPATGRFNLTQPVYADRDDFGRLRRAPVEGAENAYFIETVAIPGLGYTRHRMMLRHAAETDYIVGFNAKCSLGTIELSDIYGPAPAYADPGRELPVPVDFAETIFLPIATHRFLSAPIVQNWDVPGLRNADAAKRVEQQAEQAMALLEQMRPQARKRVAIFPGWS